MALAFSMARPDADPFLNGTFHRRLVALVTACFRHPIREGTGMVEDQAGLLGLGGSDFALINVAIGMRPVALVCVPERHWRDASMMVTFRELKRVAKGFGETVVLLPEGFVMRQPRLENAMLIAETRGAAMTATDRMSILGRLLEDGSATLSELASGIRHPDPVSAVLSLVTSGLLDMNLNAAILPTSVITMGGAR